VKQLQDDMAIVLNVTQLLQRNSFFPADKNEVCALTVFFIIDGKNLQDDTRKI